ncbi:RAIN protein, partial [Nyctiprogne leucopyga]|nr:RAIN protein [Nyctiprogne leucopyga]
SSSSSRHKRLSHLFHRTSHTSNTSTTTTSPRWVSEKKLTELLETGGKPGNSSNPAQSPGILKVFGGALSRGANYKSVLVTPRSTAREVVREALERYGLSPEDG